MSTLAAGSTSITLAPGQSLLVLPGGAGTAVLSGGQQGGVPYQLGNSRVVIGPFLRSQDVSISASMPIEYFLSAAEVGNRLPEQPVTTPQVGLSGWGGGASVPLMAVIGDSRLGASVNKATTPMSTNQVGFGGLFTVLNDLCVRVPENGWLALGSQRVTTNTGIPSANLSPMAAQVKQARELGFKTVLVGPFGINDYEVSLGPVQTVEAVFAEYTRNIQDLLADGILVFCCTDPGVRTTEAATTAKDKHAKVLRQNELLRGFAHLNAGRVILIDLHATYVVENSPTSSVPTAWFSDTVHYLFTGSYWFAKEIARVVRTVFEPAAIFQRNNYENYSFDASLPNKLGNSLMLVDTNADGVADDWSGATSLGTGVAVTPTIVAAPNGIGQAQKLVWTGTTNNTFGKFRSVNIASRIPVGSKVVLLLKLKVSAATNCPAPRVKFETNTGLNGALLEFGADANFPEDAVLTLCSYEFVMTAAMTSVQLDITQKFLGAGGITHEIYQAEVPVFG